MTYTTQTHESSFWACTQTHTRKSSDEGKIKSIKNEAGQRLYNVQSYGQRYPETEIIEDISSGLNFKKKGLQALLVRLMRPDQLKVVVACRDRLCRFGFELFEFMVK